MGAFDLKVDISRGRSMLRRLATQWPTAASRALNRSTASGQTVLVRSIAKDMGIQQAVVRKVMVFRPSTPTNLVARISASGKPLPLIAFSARGPEPSRGRGRGVSYRLQGGKGRVDKAFIATVGSHRGVWRRLTPQTGRLPIIELHGPSVPHVFVKYVDAANARINEQLPKNLVSEFRFAMAKSVAA